MLFPLPYACRRSCLPAELLGAAQHTGSTGDLRDVSTSANMCGMMHMSTAMPIPPDDCSVKCFHPAMVRDARIRLMTAPDPGEIAALFAVLSDRTRIKILLALSSVELCVCDLAAATEINRSTVSHQLRILRDHELVQRRRQGKIVYYSLADEHVTAMIGMVSAHAKHSGSGAQKEVA